MPHYLSTTLLLMLVSLTLVACRAPAATPSAVPTPPAPATETPVPATPTATNTPDPPTPIPTPSALPSTPCPKPEISSFFADPNEISTTGETTLRFGAVRFANQASISPGVGGVVTPGTRVLGPDQTTTYRLTATGCGGTAFLETTVRVQSAPPAPSGIPENGSNIDYDDGIHGIVWSINEYNNIPNLFRNGYVFKYDGQVQYDGGATIRPELKQDGNDVIARFDPKRNGKAAKRACLTFWAASKSNPQLASQRSTICLNITL